MRIRKLANRDGRTVTVLTLACAAITLGLTIVLSVGPDHDSIARARHAPPPRTRRAARRRRRSVPARAVVTIDGAAPKLPVPRSFFGLSTEYGALPLYERHFALFERALFLLHVRGDGPQILRIGGDSADRTFWDPRARRMPQWAFKLTPGLVERTARLVRRAGIRLILDLNLITGSSTIAAQWARAAERLLPRKSIVGFEVGNEPDLYAHWYWLATIGRTRSVEAMLPRALSAAAYVQDFRSYARVLGRIAPNVPLAGPALANPQRGRAWLATLLAGPHAGLRIVSAHRYPYSPCVRRTSPVYPTIDRLLSEQASAGLAASVRNAVWLAHRADLRFRLTEMNSVTCGGLRGVSDTFATALWAPDTLFEVLRAGVDGVNIHIRATTINAPFLLTRRGMVARPLMYGLLLFTRTLGPGARLMRLTLHADGHARLKAWAVRLRGRIVHVLLINKGVRAARVFVRLPSHGLATVQRLLARSASARWGITLAGQRLDRAGRWTGRRLLEKLAPHARGYVVAVPGLSAGLLSARLSAASRA
jgi:hypothetical protein